MVIGIGIDLCCIERIQDQMDNARFMARIFTDAERAYFASRPAVAAASAAANFAAKEAFLKALGLGLGGAELTNIEVLRSAGGQPYYVLHGKARELVEKKNAKPLLSLSHEGGMAAAFCVLEGDETL